MAPAVVVAVEVWRHDSVDGEQCLPTGCLRLLGQTTLLVIAETQPLTGHQFSDRLDFGLEVPLDRLVSPKIDRILNDRHRSLFLWKRRSLPAIATGHVVKPD